MIYCFAAILASVFDADCITSIPKQREAIGTSIAVQKLQMKQPMQMQSASCLEI